MKRLKVFSLTLVMACWGGALAQEKPAAPTTPAKAAPAAPAATDAKAQSAQSEKFEVKHKAYLERRKTNEASRKKVDAHLGKMRKDWAKESEKAKAAEKTRVEKGRTPSGEETTKEGSASTSK